MRTTMKKLILAFLLLSAALLAAGSAYAAPLYFPHVATSMPWQTEIAIINTGDQSVTGTLKAFSDGGAARRYQGGHPFRPRPETDRPLPMNLRTTQT